MSVVQDVTEDLRLFGSSHGREDTGRVIESIWDYRPEVVCVEAHVESDLQEHDAYDMLAAKAAAEELGADTWHIDLYESEFELGDALRDTTHKERSRLTPDAHELGELVEVRHELTRIDSAAAHYNQQREAAMSAAVHEATERYESVFVAVGAKHLPWVLSHLEGVTTDN